MSKPLTEAEQKVVADFHRLFYDRGPDGGGTWARTYWFGARVLKNPFDLWIYQELLGAVQPELVIECGTGDGGSALYFAALCTLLNKGEVLTIDVRVPRYDDPHSRITRVLGSSVEPAVVTLATLRASDKRTFVVLDSDHSYEHVRAELAAYAPLVSRGSYLVVEDTNVTEAKRAVDEFVVAHPEFEVDHEQEKYLMTFNTYLRRVA